MVVFVSEWAYLKSCTTINAQIVAIDAIIAQLYISAAQAALNNDIDEYWLNDGQTQIKTIYRGADRIAVSILSFEKLRSRLINQKAGRVMRMIDSSNFRNDGCF